MSMFYDRKETENEITIIYKYHPAFYILLLGGFVLVYAGSYIGVSESVGMIVAIGIVLLMVIYHLAIRSPGREMKKAMKSGSVQLSGSKFSFSNPLTVRIKK